MAKFSTSDDIWEYLFILCKYVWFPLKTFLITFLTPVMVLCIIAIPFGAPLAVLAGAGYIFLPLFTLLVPLLFVFIVFTRLTRIWEKPFEHYSETKIFAIIFYALSIVIWFALTGFKQYDFWKQELTFAILLLILFIIFRLGANIEIKKEN